MAGGGIYGFGDNSYGALGIGDVVKRFTPTLVTLLSSLSVVAVTTGAMHTVTLASGACVSLLAPRMRRAHATGMHA